MWFDIWKNSKNKKWYWHLRDAYEIIASGGKHSDRYLCLEDIQRVIEARIDAPINPTNKEIDEIIEENKEYYSLYYQNI